MTTSATHLARVPLTFFRLPSQPKQGRGLEQGTAIPAALSPSQGTRSPSSSPRRCPKPSHQGQQHGPAFPAAPRSSQQLPSAALAGGKTQPHQPGREDVAADT